MRATLMFRSVLFAGLATLAACGGKSSPTGPVAADPPAAAGDPTCPVAVPGTSVTAEDADNGGALVFVTTGEVAELRARVAALAAQHNEAHAAMGPLPTGDETGAHAHAHGDHAHAATTGDHAAAGGLVTVHSKAVSEEIEGGARLGFVVAPADLATLRDQLRRDAEQLASGSCQVEHAAAPPPAPTEPAAPAPEPVDPKVQLLAAETAAYDAAKPVFETFCAGCHTTGGKKAKRGMLKHFDMTTYPFAGKDGNAKGIAEVLGLDGAHKPSMPPGKAAGTVKGDDLALIKAWVDANEAAHAGGAH